MSIDKSRPLKDMIDIDLLFKDKSTVEKGFFGGRTYVFISDKGHKTKLKLDQILQTIKTLGTKSFGEKRFVVNDMFNTEIVQDEGMRNAKEKMIYDVLADIKLEELKQKKIPSHELNTSPFKQTVYKLIRFFKDFFSKNYFKKIETIEKELIPSEANENFVFLHDFKNLESFNKKLRDKVDFYSLTETAITVYDYHTTKAILNNFDSLYNKNQIRQLSSAINGYKSKEGALESLLLATLKYANNTQDNELKRKALRLLVPNLATSPLILKAFRESLINLNDYPEPKVSKLDLHSQKLHDKILEAQKTALGFPTEANARLEDALGLLDHITDLNNEQFHTVQAGISINNINLIYPNPGELYISLSKLESNQLNELLNELEKQGKTLESLCLAFLYSYSKLDTTVLNAIYQRVKDHQAFAELIKQNFIKPPPE